jgi:hypothetical protein
LSLNELLKEFKLAAESPIHNVEVLHSVQEQLRVAKASQWNTEKIQDAAQKALAIAQLRLSILGDPIKTLQELKDHYDDLLQQLEQCRKRGEEMRLEVEKLRDELKNAKNAPNSWPGLSDPEDGDEPFTREEVRALHRLLDDYITNSQQYQQIIGRLEQQVKDLTNNIHPSQFSAGKQAIFQASTGDILNQLRQQRMQCEEEKILLQDQIDSLKGNDGLIKTLQAEIASLRAAACKGDGAVQSVQVFEARIKQLETTIEILNAEIARNDPAQKADPNNRAKTLRENLKLLQTAQLNETNRANTLEKERDRLAAENNAHVTLANQIIVDIAGMRGLQNKPHPTLETAVAYLREQCAFHQDAFQSHRSLEKFFMEVVPDSDALKVQSGADKEELERCRHHSESLQYQFEVALRETSRAQAKLKECWLPLALVIVRIWTRSIVKDSLTIVQVSNIRGVAVIMRWLRLLRDSQVLKRSSLVLRTISKACMPN